MESIRYPETAASGFDDFLFGLETEHLRLDASGGLSGVSHPPSLPAPRYTRDFAENQLEIVTEPFADIHKLIERTEELTERARTVLGNEMFWPVSLPPHGIREDDVRIADFSGVPGIQEADARKAGLYRRGLALRYGKLRQLICGVHLNVSFGDRFRTILAETHVDASDDPYLTISRYLYRNLYLFILLSGASPVPNDGRGPHVVSVRNSTKGYAGTAYREYLDLSSLRAYASGLERGLRTESSAWHAFGLVNGAEVRQLNGRVFQTEKEFYAPIRFRASVSERLPGAVYRGRIDRLELRFLDLDPYESGGVSERMIRVLHLAILNGARSGPPPFSRDLLAESLLKADAAAELPVEDLAFRRTDTAKRLLDDAHAELEKLSVFAAALDGGRSAEYGDALSHALFGIRNPGTLPSVRLSEDFGRSGMNWNDFIRSRERETDRNGGIHERHAAGL